MNFNNYLHFIKGKKRQSKINGVKLKNKLCNKDFESIKTTIHNAIDETKIIDYKSIEPSSETTTKKIYQKTKEKEKERNFDLSREI